MPRTTIGAQEVCALLLVAIPMSWTAPSAVAIDLTSSEALPSSYAASELIGYLRDAWWNPWHQTKQLAPLSQNFEKVSRNRRGGGGCITGTDYPISCPSHDIVCRGFDASSIRRLGFQIPSSTKLSVELQWAAAIGLAEAVTLASSQRMIQLNIWYYIRWIFRQLSSHQCTYDRRHSWVRYLIRKGLWGFVPESKTF
jgi:hypothetical protein